ncbi:MAG: cytochrome c oxidase assembly protein [Actinomycetes bacterium]
MVFAGADLPPPLTGRTGFTEWQFDLWLAVGLCVVAALYLWGALRLARRGDRWPVSRTIAFVGLGLGSIGVATMSSLGVYDGTLFWMHMVQHMVLQMVAPVFLALGAPVTLALRTLHRRPRQWLLGAIHSWVGRVLAFPPVGMAAFVVAPFALYFTGWYQATLTHTGLHELQHLLFVAVGAMFMWPLLGIDPIPNRSPYLLRVLTTFLVLPAHAILGITIMQSKTLIAGSYYVGLGRTWGPSLADDQNIGGGILWASGDLVGLLFLAVLIAQWMRADTREAARIDRALDRAAATAVGTGNSGEGELSAYNAMLTRLAEHDAVREAQDVLRRTGPN